MNENGGEAEICNSRHVERNEELEVGARILGSLVCVSDLSGLPVVGTDIEGEGIDAVSVGELDIFQPGILGVGVGVSHHVVGSNNLVAASPFGYRNGISERWKVETSRGNYKQVPGDRKMGVAPARRAIVMVTMNLTRVIIVSDLDKS